MKLLVLFSLPFIIASCAAKEENYYSKSDIIEINKYSIPDSSKVFDTIQIEAEAEEPNACWKNLNFVLSKTRDFEYKLQAFGTYENFGEICPAEIVLKDTLIGFSPTKSGKYLFYVNITPSKVIIDSLIVK